jgi:hypothetical protein
MLKVNTYFRQYKDLNVRSNNILSCGFKSCPRNYLYVSAVRENGV